ncbi:hypothetical protein CEXT_402081 [Caerostris extrusa]|uniref:Uncharacterized protein n=1 Tax=Caerostris extrusa TaxID=172846 RepID=A0AAV4W6F1_CAEEX|nr:hypothetical protein CEXT_402081 [Caerostris extrusa]
MGEGGLSLQNFPLCPLIIFEKEVVNPSLLLEAQNVLSSVFGLKSLSQQEGWIYAIVSATLSSRLNESVIVLPSSTFEKCESRNNNKRGLLCPRKE